MFFKIATTHQPATDLGFLLRKNPDKPHPFELSFGNATVFYPAADEQYCEAFLTVDIPFVRELTGDDSYVSDRRFAAGSYLPSAIQQVFRSAINSVSRERPELAVTPIPLQLTMSPVVVRGDLTPNDLFEPLGWTVKTTAIPLDPQFPAWGAKHHRIEISGRHTVADALRHVCIMLPVLDPQRHFYMTEAEVERLQKMGDGWLDLHPYRDRIVKRYLRYRRLLTQHREATVTEDDADDAVILKPNLHQQRMAFCVDLIKQQKGITVVDMGCGEGALIQSLMPATSVNIIGVDPSPFALENAGRRLKLDRMQETERKRISLLQGAAIYADDRLKGADVCVLSEVIEHIDERRLPMLETAIFGDLQPKTVIVTTPNREWNAVIGIGDRLRHRDHRFEWTRAEGRAWADGVCSRQPYCWVSHEIGEDMAIDDNGAPTQAFVFTRTT